MSSSFDWDSICHDFYLDNLPVNQIIKKYSLPVNNSIYKIFPNYIHKELECEYCKKNLESSFMNRGQGIYSGDFDLALSKREISEELGGDRYGYGSRLISNGSAVKTPKGYLVDTPACQECKHKPRADCKCESCRELRASNYRKAIEEVKSGLDFSNVLPPAEDKFTFQNIFSCLLVLSDECVSESGSYDLSFLTEEDKKRLIEENFFFIDENSIGEMISMTSTYEFRVNYRGLKYKYYRKSSVKDSISSLKKQAIGAFSSDDNKLDLLESWNRVALDEALLFLAFECKALGIPVNTGKKTLSIIQKSLTKFGLAQTATYIRKAVDNAHNYGKRMGYSGRQTFNQIYGNMCFWVDDERSRQYKTRPLTRGEEGLQESREGMVFYHAFLSVYGVDFFSDPINLRYLNPEQSRSAEEGELAEG